MVILLYYFINYYYCFFPTSILKKSYYYIIFNDNQKYYLCEIKDYDLTNWQYQVTSSISWFDSFVENKFHSIVSDNYDKKFALLKDSHDSNGFSPYIYVQPISLNWYDNWILKSNSLEHYYYSIRGKYPVIDDSFYYFL